MKSFLKMVVGILAIFALSDAFAQSAAVNSRIIEIDRTMDVTKGVVFQTTSGAQVSFPNLEITVGDNAARECVRWGKTVPTGWDYFWGIWDTVAKTWAKNCIAANLTSKYAARKTAYQQALLNSSIPSFVPVGSITNPPGANGLIASGLSISNKIMESQIMDSWVEQNYSSITGTYGALVVPQAVQLLPYPTVQIMAGGGTISSPGVGSPFIIK